ncbi:hypothetical protein BURMUCF2_2648 [Burkholderia multivorans CF2]|nr:hypothetical protein BURMUCF2_2648 [Burkholderia multivorans CF2]
MRGLRCAGRRRKRKKNAGMPEGSAGVFYRRRVARRDVPRT